MRLDLTFLGLAAALQTLSHRRVYWPVHHNVWPAVAHAMDVPGPIGLQWAALLSLVLWAGLRADRERAAA